MWGHTLIYIRPTRDLSGSIDRRARTVPTTQSPQVGNLMAGPLPYHRMVDGVRVVGIRISSDVVSFVDPKSVAIGAGIPERPEILHARSLRPIEGVKRRAACKNTEPDHMFELANSNRIAGLSQGAEVLHATSFGPEKSMLVAIAVDRITHDLPVDIHSVRITCDTTKRS